MPKLPIALAATLFLLLSACGTGKPASGLPSDPDALLKRVKVEMEEQRAFAVRDCAYYGPCEPGHENFALSYVRDFNEEGGKTRTRPHPLACCPKHGHTA